MKTIGSRVLVGALLAIALALFSAPALADQIGLGGGTGSITFTSNGNGTLNFSTAGFSVGSPLATFQSPTGTVLDFGSASFGSMSGMAGPESSNVFPITSGGSESFSFTGATDSLTGTIQWVGIKDDTTTPQFDVESLLTIATSSGTSAFTNDFPSGSMAEIDITVKGTTTLTDLAALGSGNTATFTFSSGEVNPIPEPSSLALLGMAFLMIGACVALKREAFEPQV